MFWFSIYLSISSELRGSRRIALLSSAWIRLGRLCVYWDEVQGDGARLGGDDRSLRYRDVLGESDRSPVGPIEQNYE